VNEVPGLANGKWVAFGSNGANSGANTATKIQNPTRLTPIIATVLWRSPIDKPKVRANNDRRGKILRLGSFICTPPQANLILGLSRV